MRSSSQPEFAHTVIISGFAHCGNAGHGRDCGAQVSHMFAQTAPVSHARAAACLGRASTIMR